MSEDEAERELFDHLVAEFGDRGQDAVQFLRTARRLAAEDPAGELPRAAGAAAYCVREALQRLLPPESGRPRWRELTDEVLEAYKRLQAVRGLPGADAVGALEQLLTAIGQLEQFKEREQGQHQRRLVGLMEARAGTPPLDTSAREYQRLLAELNRHAVHASVVSVEQVRELLGRALSLLRMVFAPFQLRQPELDALAQLQDPSEEDVQRLRLLCSTPHHLSYFMQRLVAPEWLWLLTPHRLLDPPASGVWPARFVRLSTLQPLTRRMSPRGLKTCTPVGVAVKPALPILRSPPATASRPRQRRCSALFTTIPGRIGSASRQ